MQLLTEEKDPCYVPGNREGEIGMRVRRLVTVLANASAILLLGLVGAAVAGPSLVIGSLNLYGPELLSGFFSFDAFVGSDWGPTSFAVSDSLFYAVANVSGIFMQINDNTAQLLNTGIYTIALLPPNDSIFASAIPEPIVLSLLVSGVAAVAFVRRRFRRSRPA